MQHKHPPLTFADIDGLAWSKVEGLLPAVIQDRLTLQVLMLAYMSRETLHETIGSGRATFYSRSRRAHWRKGETLGAWLENAEVFTDCDGDALLVLADPAGPACHLGRMSCFTEKTAPGIGWLGQLTRIISARTQEPAEASYTRRLLDEGPQRAAQKVGEEGVETALAGAAGDPRDLTDESADLLYHLLVLLQARGVPLTDVIEVLRSRHAGDLPPMTR